MKRLKDTKQLGQLIRRVRKNQGLTQEQLAAASGVGIRFVRELEQGKESCQIGKSIWIAHMLGIHLMIDGAESS